MCRISKWIWIVLIAIISIDERIPAMIYAHEDRWCCKIPTPFKLTAIAKGVCVCVGGGVSGSYFLWNVCVVPRIINDRVTSLECVSLRRKCKSAISAHFRRG